MSEFKSSPSRLARLFRSSAIAVGWVDEGNPIFMSTVGDCARSLVRLSDHCGEKSAIDYEAMVMPTIFF